MYWPRTQISGLLSGGRYSGLQAQVAVSIVLRDPSVLAVPPLFWTAAYRPDPSA